MTTNNQSTQIDLLPCPIPTCGTRELTVCFDPHGANRPDIVACDFCNLRCPIDVWQNLPRVSSTEGKQIRETNPAERGCLCQRCGRRYHVDLQVSEGLWNRIHGEYNLLCGPCITNEIEALNEAGHYHLIRVEALTDALLGLLPIQPTNNEIQEREP